MCACVCVGGRGLGMGADKAPYANKKREFGAWGVTVVGTVKKQKKDAKKGI